MFINRAFRALYICALSVAAIFLSACASDGISLSGPAMALGAPVAPPAAYLDYCVRTPAECGVDPSHADAGQVVTRRYWKAVFAASDHRLRDGRIDWAGIAGDIDEAPAAIRTESTAGSGQAFGQGMSADQFLNTYGGPELAAVAGHASTVGASRPTGAAAAIRRVTWNTETRSRVALINRKVNQQVVERPDIATYGVEDYWAIPTLQGNDRYGDCEDYVLMKRRDLIAAGVAPEALSIAIVETQNRSSHAVLLISTDRGDFVLDNLDPAIRNWTETTYHWIERQAPGSAFAWAKPGAAVVPAPVTLGPSQTVARLAPRPAGPVKTGLQALATGIVVSAPAPRSSLAEVAPASQAGGAFAFRDTALMLDARFAQLREP
jgi:predicted transglutaminase-like cysteine proteinase